MTKKRTLCMFLVSLLLLVGLTFTACPSNIVDGPKEAGPETGTYYYSLPNDNEYTVTLSNGDKFSFSVMDEIKSGTYELSEEGELKLTFYKEPGQDQQEELIASYHESYFELTYKDQQMRFLKKVVYTVSFDMGPAEAIEAVEIINGKTVAQPQKPTLLGYHFMGWYTDETYSTPFAFGTQKITQDTTIYARWVVDDPSIPEYLVELHSNIEGEEVVQLQTIGGRVYDLPTLTRGGYDFKGWWVSMYDDAEKLSYKYTEDMILKENTKLFAYWQSVDSGSKLSNPVIHIGESAITWEGIVGAINYDIIIKQIINPEKNEFIDIATATEVTPSYNINFADLEPGDYEITVKAMAASQANNSENTIYYKNKALSRVSHFAVAEPSILSFNAIDGATRYEISVDVGDELVNIYNYNNGNNTFFDFSTFPMPEEGIKFTVTAKAEGRASSTRTFVYNRVLNQIQELFLDKDNEVVFWDKVPNATNYIVSISSGNSTEEDQYIDIGNRTSFSLKAHAPKEGGIIINVMPKTKGWNSPAFTKIKYEKTRLAAPRSIKVLNREIVWNEIPGASSYEIKIGSLTDTTTKNSYELPADFDIKSTSLYHINIRAKGVEDSLWSDEFALRGSMSNLVYQNSIASWDYVFGATGYEVFVNGEKQATVQDINYAEIYLTAGGNNIVSARAIFEDGGYSNTISLNVYAHTVRFETGKGKELAEVYYATGDKIRDIKGEREGYDFAGWYLYTGQNMAGRFTDSYYEYTGDITLYATWEALSFTVQYDLAGGVANNTTAIVKYDSGFELDVPTIDDGRVFGGWYTLSNGTGIRLTDEFGRSVKNWDIGEDTTIYAFWANAIKYHAMFIGDEYVGWIISKGPDINRINHLIIPETHKNNDFTESKPIREIDSYAFADLYNLVSITFPNSITYIGENAFASCVNLESFEVFGTYADYRFSSLDGVLFNTDKSAIEMFPLAKKGEYHIPDTVRSIGSGTFAGAIYLTKIIIPSSVHSSAIDGVFVHGIETQAFLNCSSLETVEFLASKDEEPLPLTIADHAFRGCTQLKDIILPERLKDLTYIDHEDKEQFVKGISSTVFAGCSNLVNIFVDRFNEYYSDIDGVLVNKEKTHLIFYPMGKTGDYIVPNTITTITNGAFKGYKNLFEVTISENVETIESYAFQECVGLTKLVFVSSEKELEINERAFDGCTKLETIIFEEGSNVKTIGNYAFYRCTTLQSLTIPGTIVNIGEYAFNYCYGMKSLTFEATEGGNVLVIQRYAFSNCSSLQTVIFEENCNITEIGRSAFSSCYALTTISIPETVTTIEDYAFSSCSSLGSIIIPENVVKIGSSAFSGCSSLTEVTIEGGDNPLSIGSYAFSNCESLGKIDIPARVNSLSLDAFRGCTGLSGIYVHKDNNSYSDIDGVLFSKDGTRLIFYPQGKGTEYTLPDGVQIISARVFQNYVEIEKIIIPTSVILIEEYAFSKSTIKEVIFAEGTSSEELIIEKQVFEYCEQLTSIIFPSHLYEIGSSCFQYCTNLTTVEFRENCIINKIGVTSFLNAGITKITIPKNVTIVGTNAFLDCVQLETVEFEAGGDKDLFIGLSNHSPPMYNGYVFKGCINLKSITIPARAISIGSYNFENCTKLESITFEENSRLEYIGQYAFSGCTSLKEITIPKTVQNKSREGTVDTPMGLDRNAFNGCTALEKIVFEDGGTAALTIGQQAFRNCSSLIKIDIPARVVGDSTTPAIGSNAFEGCTSLTAINIHPDNPGLSSVEGVLFNKDKSILMAYPVGKQGAFEVPGSVQTIENSAFRYAEGLTAITFADAELDEDGKEISLEIGTGTSSTYVFESCYNLKTIEFPDRLTSIGNYAFRYCNSLTEIHLPKNLTYLGTYAFAYCGSLNKVVFDKDGVLTQISNYAFQYSALETVEISDTITQIGTYAFRYSNLKEFIYSENTSLENIGNYAFADTALVSFTIPSTVTTLGTNVFYNATALETVNILGNIKTINANVFDRCSSLKNINITENNENYTSINGVMFDKKAEKLIFYPRGRAGAYEIPSGVKSIEAAAFGGTSTASGNEKLTSVTIPTSVTNIGNNAFRYCTALKTVIFEKDTDGTAGELTIGGSGSSYVFQYSGITSIEIPARTKSIANYAFNYCSDLRVVTFEKKENAIDLTLGSDVFRYAGLTSIEIPARLTSMGNYAFSYCVDLATISFEANGKLSTLNPYVFQNNESLTSIHIPKFITTINSNAFRDCKNLTKVTFENGSQLQTIGGFYGCESLTDISIPNSVTTFTANAFQYSGLTSITIPPGITEIPNYAFSGSKIKRVTIPASVNSIGNSAFSSCADLQEVVIEGSIATLNNNLFQNCTSLTTIIIPDTVTSIGNYVFQNNKSLTHIVIPEGVTTIGNYAFDGCENLVSVTLPSTLESIGTYVFRNCLSLTQINLPNKITQISNYAFEGTGLTTFTVPSSITTIGDYAFRNCENLTQINIGASVASIGANPFAGCAKLESINLAPNNVSFFEDDGVLYNGGKSQLITYPAGKKSASYEVLDTVTTISAYGFFGNTYITNVVIPEGVTAINDNTFENCVSLTNVDIRGKLTTIGTFAFAYTNLESFTVDNTVSSIGGSAFIGSQLQELIFEKGGDGLNIAGYAFENCVNLTKLELPSHLRSISSSYSVTDAIGTSAFKGCINLTEVIFEDGGSGVTVGSSVFEGCTNLTKVVFPNTLRDVSHSMGSNNALGASIFKNCINLTEVIFKYNTYSVTMGSSVFEGCIKLAEIELPENLVSIGANAFSGSGLREIVVPASVTIMGNGIFQNCLALESVVLNTNYSSVPQYTFQNCVNLTNVKLSSKTVYVYAYAFDGCSSLTSIVLPAGLRQINDYAFAGCTSIEELNIPSSVIEIRSFAFSGWSSSQTIYMGLSAPTDGWYEDWQAGCFAKIVWAS